jgi:hypothetical protein
MHLVIGYVLAKLLKQHKSKGELLPVISGQFEVAHHLPGRIRFRIPLLESGNDDVMAAIKKELLNIPDINSVQINAVSAGLLVEFDAEKIDAAIICEILIRLLGLEKIFDNPPESAIQKEIKALGNALNRQIFNSTAGILDSQSALFLAVFVLGLYVIFVKRDRSLPGGINMLWWSYVILKSRGR